MNIPMIRMPRANKFGKCMCLSCQKHHDGNGSVEEKWDKNQGKSLRLQLCNRSSKMPNSSNVGKYQNCTFSRAANQIEMTFYATAPWRRESRECRTVPSSASPLLCRISEMEQVVPRRRTFRSRELCKILSQTNRQRSSQHRKTNFDFCRSRDSVKSAVRTSLCRFL